jgi:hypothetical protein
MIGLLLFFAILSSNAYAVGISPAKLKINFEPGLDKEVSLRVSNNLERDVTVFISFEGDLAKHFTVEKDLIRIPAMQEEVVSCRINLPAEIGQPGEHEVKIIVSELPEQAVNEKRAVVSATGTVVAKAIILVPYPETYAEAKLYVFSEGKNVRFSIPVSNLGTNSIKAKAKITIIAPTKETVIEIYTETVSVEPSKEAKLSAEWQALVAPGEYTAVVRVYYNDKEIEIAKKFNVGELFVKVVKVEVLNFALGQVAKFNIYLQNNWSNTLEGVFADMQISDSQGKIYTNYRTATVTLEPQKITRTEAFWDTSGVGLGTYEMKLLLHYLDKVFEETFSLQVNLDSIQIAPVGQVIGPAGALETKTTIIVLVLLVLVVAASIIIIYVKKKKT